MNLGFIKVLLLATVTASCLSVLPVGIALDAAHASLPPGFGPTRPGRVASVGVTPGGYSIFGGKQATLTWTRSPGATSYQLASRLMADVSSPWNLLPYRVKKTSWTLQPFLIGRRYQFRVQPFNSAGRGPATLSAVTRMKGTPARQVYAALGDSYSSGLGASGLETADCHRNSRAWAFRIQTRDQGPTRLLACAGATIPDIVRQIPPMNAFFARHPDAPQLITVTVGGNDVGFADVLQQCVTRACMPMETALRLRIARVGPRLTAFYRTLRTAHRYADIIAGGYPQVLEPMGTSGNILCKLITSPERLMLTRLSNQLNRTITAAAAGAGIWSVGLRVSSEFAGHNACANPSREWIHAGTFQLGGMAGVISSKSFHPKDPGQAAFAEAFSAALLARSV